MTEGEGKSWIGAAAFTGGFLWMAHYALQLGFGIATGRILFEAGETIWGKMDGLAFFGAYLSLGLALIGLARSLSDSLKGWRRAGAFFACGPILAGSAGIGAAFMPSEMVGVMFPICGKIGILALFLSAIFTGCGLYRAEEFHPRWAGAFLLLFGWLTAPVAMLLMPLEAVMPPYMVTEVHFAFVGAAWMMLGRTLLTRQGVSLSAHKLNRSEREVGREKTRTVLSRSRVH